MYIFVRVLPQLQILSVYDIFIYRNGIKNTLVFSLGTLFSITYMCSTTEMFLSAAA